MKKCLDIKLTAFILLMLSANCLLSGCKEDIGIEVNKIGEKPEMVSNVRVTPISGGAIIKYDLPLSEDLRYVEATYILDNGIKRETKASIYKNELIVGGFGHKGAYDVELRAVSVGQVASNPLIVKVEVLTPPHLQVLQDLLEGNNVEIAFGGFNVKYLNETKADLIIGLVKKDSTGKWLGIKEEYTNFEKGTIQIREQEAEPTDFGIFVRDRWNHFSDTLVINLTPIKEIRIPVDAWKEFYLRGDAIPRSGWEPLKMWDDRLNTGFWSARESKEGNIQEAPGSLTIDMGQPALLSRLHMFPHNTDIAIYGVAHVYDFSIYGSNNPSLSGDFDNSWTHISRFVSARPSGLPFGSTSTSEENKRIREEGETFEFPDPTGFEKFRYIRIRIWAVWSGSYEGEQPVRINEFRLFGQL